MKKLQDQTCTQEDDEYESNIDNENSPKHRRSQTGSATSPNKVHVLQINKHQYGQPLKRTNQFQRCSNASYPKPGRPIELTQPSTVFNRSFASSMNRNQMFSREASPNFSAAMSITSLTPTPITPNAPKAQGRSSQTNSIEYFGKDCQEPTNSTIQRIQLSNFPKQVPTAATPEPAFAMNNNIRSQSTGISP